MVGGIDTEAEPKDLGVKIGTKSEAQWTSIMKIQETNIVSGEVNLAISKAVLELCKKKIKAEKQKV